MDENKYDEYRVSKFEISGTRSQEQGKIQKGFDIEESENELKT